MAYIPAAGQAKKNQLFVEAGHTYIPTQIMTYTGDFSYPISKKLGKELGLPAALMLGQLEYWTQREAGIVHDGLWWIYNSFKSWPFSPPR